jgi:DNA-binding protein YbaB
MFTPDSQSVELAERIHRELTSYQVRAEAGKAIAVVNGTQDIVKIYGTDLDYEENKEMLDNIAKAANDALRSSEIAAAAAVMGSDDMIVEDDPFDMARKATYTAKSGDIEVTVDGTQQFIKLEGGGLTKKFANDILNAMNAAFAQSMLAMGDVLVKISSEQEV